MSMFSDIQNGMSADALGKKILLAIQEHPESKEFVTEYFLPIYNDFVSDSWGAENKDLYNQINNLLNK